MSDWGALYIETLEIEQWKLLSNSNGHNLTLGGPIQAHNISRRSKLNNGSYLVVQMIITFHLEVRFASHIETLEIEQRKLSRNSNGHNFSLGGLIQAHNISRRSKLKNGSSREIQMDITSHSEVRFRRITYRDAWNWATEALENFKWSLLFTWKSDSGTSHISRRSKLNSEALS